ncbi:MAG: RNA polymerase sigma factor [Marinicella sp.]|nr:RNA polymerase sigma factor [Xanthomonadales bacterium]
MENQQIRRLKLVNQERVLSLVNRVVSADDHTAFARLVQSHQSLIRHFLRRLTAGDRAKADDLSQECFLLAYQKIHQYNSSGSFSGWLHTIAYRLFLKSIDKVESICFDADFHAEKTAQDSMDADIYAEQLMALLNHKERAVMTLSCAAGMSHAEIQQITKLPLGTIKSLIQRGKSKIIQAVESEQIKQQVQS